MPLAFMCLFRMWDCWPLIWTGVNGGACRSLGRYFASPVAGDDKDYLASEEGTVTVLQAGGDLRTLKVNDLGEEIYATPALVDGAVFVRTRSHLHCFGRACVARVSTPSGQTSIRGPPYGGVARRIGQTTGGRVDPPRVAEGVG
jgi:hypothetical protein